MYSTQAKNGQQSIVKNKHESQRKLVRQLSAASLALLPLLLTLPYDSTFLPGREKAISRSHTPTYINVTATQSTQQACLWETSGPRWHFPVQL